MNQKFWLDNGHIRIYGIISTANTAEEASETMARRRKDRFAKEMGRIHRARQTKRAQRLKDRRDGNGSRFAEAGDSIRFNAQEFNALGISVAKGAAKESVLARAVDNGLGWFPRRYGHGQQRARM